jgi:hypothetical protein
MAQNIDDTCDHGLVSWVLLSRFHGGSADSDQISLDALRVTPQAASTWNAAPNCPEHRHPDLAPGMALTVEIRTGGRGVIEYLRPPLSPSYRREAVLHVPSAVDRRFYCCVRKK